MLCQKSISQHSQRNLLHLLIKEDAQDSVFRSFLKIRKDVSSSGQQQMALALRPFQFRQRIV